MPRFFSAKDGWAFGALAGCLPAAVAFVVFGFGDDAQGGMGVLFLLMINAPLGMIAGFASGELYAAEPRLAIATLPCMGVVAGGIISISFHIVLWIPLPVLGGLVGYLIARARVA